MLKYEFFIEGLCSVILAVCHQMRVKQLFVLWTSQKTEGHVCCDIELKQSQSNVVKSNIHAGKFMYSDLLCRLIKSLTSLCELLFDLCFLLRVYI